MSAPNFLCAFGKGVLVGEVASAPYAGMNCKTIWLV
jgi:hypothetical protein